MKKAARGRLFRVGGSALGNQLFIRGYALGYSLQFGAVVKADPATLWGLRLSATPPR